MALTLAQFAEMNPTGSGAGHINVLYTQDSGEFVVQAMTIPFTSKNGIDLRNALIEADTISFELNSKKFEIDVNSIQLKSSYYFINFEDFIIPPASVPTDLNYGTVYGPTNGFLTYSDSLFVLTPYAPEGFSRSPYNVLGGNATTVRTSRYIRVVDRSEDQAIPTNLFAILTGSASPATVQDSYYSSVGWTTSRYTGTLLGSGSIFGDTPAQSLTSFEASLHPSGSDAAVLKDPTTGYEREVQQIYFNSGNQATSNTFPSITNLLYTVSGNKFSRIPNRSIYSPNSNKVYTTDEFGKVEYIQ